MRMTTLRDRPVEALNPLLKDRLTTMPRLDGSKDPSRPAAGTPKEPLELLMKLLFDSDKSQLGLKGPLSDTQRREDAVQWFKEATDYVQRTATMYGQRPLLFQSVPWTAADLTARLARVQLLAVVVERGAAFIELLMDTLKVERADLMRMCDVLLGEVDAHLQRPTLEAALRQDLQSLAEVPMQLWRQRQAEIQQARSQNVQLQGEIEALRTELAAARDEIARLRDAPKPPPPDPSALGGRRSPEVRPSRQSRRTNR
jgi:hypothetical protein